MTPEQIATLIEAGPWVVVVALVVFLYRQVALRRWVQWDGVALIIEQYRERIAERDQLIERQQRIIEASGGINDATLDLLAQRIERRRRQAGEHPKRSHGDGDGAA